MNIKIAPHSTQDTDQMYAEFRELYHAGEAKRALELIQKIIPLRPNNAVVLSNAASAAQRAEQTDLAMDYAHQSLKIEPNYINSLDILSYTYYLKEDDVSAGQYGLRALQLRDASIVARYPQIPALPHVMPRPNGPKIIAFSLFGSSPKYLEGALMNAKVAPTIYPDWVCRFYVDDTVPESTQQQLREYGAQVIRVTGEAAQWVGTVWRFMAAADEDAARIIFRDVDSIVSWREAEAVREWEQSGKLFHTIRDGGSHTEAILAGLWGMVGGAIPDMMGALRQYFSQPVSSTYFADQFFLREHIWIYVRQDVFSHDRLFGFMNGIPLPAVPDGVDLRTHHIGSCQIMGQTVNCPFPDGTMMNWSVQTRIHPIRQRDFGLETLAEMRPEYEYQTPVQNGKITVFAPRLYWEGLATGDTVIKITTPTKPNTL